MSIVVPVYSRFFAGARVVAIAAGATMAAFCLASPAAAQQKPAPAAQQKPAPAAGGAGKKEESSAWVKLCEVQTHTDEATKKEIKSNVCLTHHERFHPNTGQPLISAAVRNVDNPKDNSVMIMVPLGRLLKPGLVMEIDKQKPIKIDYSYCTALGCVAQMVSTPEIIQALKEGSELIIGTIDVTKKRVGFKVPLNGFGRALDGPPIDRKVYAEARKQMFKQIYARQAELLKRAKEEAAKKKTAGGAEQPAAKKAQ